MLRIVAIRFENEKPCRQPGRLPARLAPSIEQPRAADFRAKYIRVGGWCTWAEALDKHGPSGLIEGKGGRLYGEGRRSGRGLRGPCRRDLGRCALGGLGRAFSVGRGHWQLEEAALGLGAPEELERIREGCARARNGSDAVRRSWAV